MPIIRPEDIPYAAPTSKIRAFLSSTVQSITASTWEMIELDGETHDVDEEFASYKFTAKTAGYYLIIGKVYFDGIADTAPVLVGIRINGNVDDYTYTTQGTTADACPCVACVRYLSVNDYVELWGYHADPSAASAVNNEDVTALSCTLLPS